MQVEGLCPKPNMVCIDVGANIGSIALIWAKYIKKGKIFAIEPNPKAYLSLMENILNNN